MDEGRRLGEHDLELEYDGMIARIVVLARDYPLFSSITPIHS